MFELTRKHFYSLATEGNVRLPRVAIFEYLCPEALFYFRIPHKRVEDSVVITG